MAENDGAEAAIYRPVHENQKQLDRTTLTSHDVELLSVIASMPDRLQAARARELILLNIQTVVGWIVADLNVLPHKVDILGIGIAKDNCLARRTKLVKPNGLQSMPAGITPNARADRDAVGGLADLLAHEIAINNFGIMDMIRTRHPQLWQSRMWFSKSEENGVGKINRLIKQVTKQIPTWDKDKCSGLFRKCATGILLAAEVDSDAVNRFMNWKGDTQSRS
ncbi:TPA: hypothetical protein ACH3X1_009249 [Trebouxia sp. C0004]